MRAAVARPPPMVILVNVQRKGLMNARPEGDFAPGRMGLLLFQFCIIFFFGGGVLLYQKTTRFVLLF